MKGSVQCRVGASCPELCWKSDTLIGSMGWCSGVLLRIPVNFGVFTCCPPIFLRELHSSADHFGSTINRSARSCKGFGISTVYENTYALFSLFSDSPARDSVYSLLKCVAKC
jgi:hypothetical protein